MYRDRFRPWETATLLSLCVGLCVGVWAQSRQEKISSQLLRLHVIAVSDETLEQEIKLAARDAVLEYLSPRLDTVKTVAQAEALISNELENIAQAAAQASRGRQVRALLCRERYPVREYGGLMLPAGEYRSLQVVLGEGRGHNWWCVVFPPLCLGDSDSWELEETMDQETFALVTGAEGYRLRFRAVELWGELMNRIEDK